MTASRLLPLGDITVFLARRFTPFRALRLLELVLYKTQSGHKVGHEQLTNAVVVFALSTS